MRSFDELNNLTEYTEYAEQNASQHNQSVNITTSANDTASISENDTDDEYTTANANASGNTNAVTSESEIAGAKASANANDKKANAQKSDKKAKSGGLKFDKLFKFFSKAGIKKFVLILYCVVPLLIVSVGFAAWTIIGNEVQSGSGTFNAYGIINSYDYIQLATTDIGAIDFYATGFVDNEGKIVKTHAFDITYNVNMTECAKLLYEESTSESLKKSTSESLTAEFEFYFNSGTADYSAFFNNLSCKVIIVDYGELTAPKNNETIEIEITDVGVITYKGESTAENNHTLTLLIEPDSNLVKQNSNLVEQNTSQTIRLKLTYTLDPGDDYQKLYNLVSSLSNEKPMIDVRITDEKFSV